VPGELSDAEHDLSMLRPSHGVRVNARTRTRTAGVKIVASAIERRLNASGH
jgi:hypothetical protein